MNDAKAYFVYRYTVAGRERETSLGPYPELGLAEARIQHAELRKMVKVDRVDPIEQRRSLKASAAQPSAKPTFGQCADQFVETHKTGWRNSKHAWQWSQTLSTHAAAIREMPVDEVNTEAVLRVLTPLWSAVPETAARLRGRIEAVPASAQVDGWIPEDKPNPARWRNWLERKLPKRQRLTRGHHKAMPYQDVPAFMCSLSKTPGVAARALMLTILTAARTSEILGILWDEKIVVEGDVVDAIDFDKAVLTVAAERMKTGEPHSIPLNDPALAILRAQEQSRGRNPYVFPGRPQHMLSGMSMAMLLRRMGCSVTVHGFRSSFRVWCSEVNHTEFEVAESCLSHRIGNKVSRDYNRTKMIERRRPVMVAWAAYVMRDANVVPLKRRVRAPLGA